MKKRVLEINVDDQNTGGVFALVRNVITGNKSDVKIDIAAIEPFKNSQNVRYLKNYGCDVYYIGYEGNKWKKQLTVYKKLKKLLQKKKYDYVHIHADTANKLLVSGLASKQAGVENIIFHSHSSGVEGNGRIKILAHKLSSMLLKHVGTTFVACSAVAAKWMYPNVNISKIIIIKNGVPLEKFRFSPLIREQIRKELDVKDDILIGHVGRLMAPKNHAFLIEIIKAMIEEGISVKLLIVGEGYKEEELKRLVKLYRLQNRVIFYGISDRVNELMMGMDVLCLPSFFEGLPIVGIEAQAAGLPVVFSDRITTEAKIRDSVEFVPIDKGSISIWIKTILKLIESTERSIVANSDVRNAGFDISDTVNSFLILYN